MFSLFFNCSFEVLTISIRPIFKIWVSNYLMPIYLLIILQNSIKHFSSFSHIVPFAVFLINFFFQNFTNNHFRSAGEIFLYFILISEYNLLEIMHWKHLWLNLSKNICKNSKTVLLLFQINSRRPIAYFAEKPEQKNALFYGKICGISLAISWWWSGPEIS